jgi:small basic protein
MPASKAKAKAAATAGAVSVAAIPAGILASRWVTGVNLLQSLYYSVPFALFVSLIALFGSRRARLEAQRMVFQDRVGPLRAARRLAWLGVYMGITAALAVAVYWILRSQH